MTRDELIARQEEIKLSILGYKKNTDANFSNSTALRHTASIIKALPRITSPQGERLTVEEVIALSKSFFDKYFTVHKISHVPVETIVAKQGEIAASTGAQTARNFNSLLTQIDPFELPVKLVTGHSMIGEVQKPLIVAEGEEYAKIVEVPFAYMNLGKELTLLSAATHAHETAHTQTESNKGYAIDFFNKEVISIFIEKLAALEFDPTGELLRLSERNRYKYISDFASIISDPFKAYRKQGISKIAIRDAQLAVQSTLYATKLFDNYLLATLEGKKAILVAIQAIFDGKLTVEELLESQGITLNNAREEDIVRRHI